jgi:hypothetical protein
VAIRAPDTAAREQIVVALLAALIVELARLQCDVPEQDLDISLRRMRAVQPTAFSSRCAAARRPFLTTICP